MNNIKVTQPQTSNRVAASNDGPFMIGTTALKCTTSGKVIHVDDVSPIKHLVNVKLHSKNLLDDVTCTIETQTIDGVTITKNGDGSYTLSGENTSGGLITFESTRIPQSERMTLPPGTYITSGGCDVKIAGWSESWLDGNRVYHIDAPFQVIGWFCDVYKDNKVFGLHKLPYTFYPLLETGDEATNYEPYVNISTVTVTRCGIDETDNPKTYTPEIDGTVNDILALSPTMTLLTDNEFVTIEVEYEQDINRVKEKHEQKLKEHGETLSEHTKEISDISSTLSNQNIKINNLGGDIQSLADSLSGIPVNTFIRMVNVAELPTKTNLEVNALYRVNKTEGLAIIPGALEFPATLYICDELPEVGEPSILNGEIPEVINLYCLTQGEDVNGRDISGYYVYTTDGTWNRLFSIYSVQIIHSRDDFLEIDYPACFLVNNSTFDIYAVSAVVGNEKDRFVLLTPSKNHVEKSEFDEAIGDINTAFDELHTYAQTLINGGTAE